MYAFDTLNLGPKLELTGGLRYDYFEVDYTATDAAGVVAPFGRTDEFVSWRAGVVYKPRPFGSVYAGVGTSVNPSAEGLSLNPALAELEPEKSWSVEVGTKWDLYQQRLSLTGAVFHTEKTNARTPGVDPGDPAQVLEGEQTRGRRRAGPLRRPGTACSPPSPATPTCGARSRPRTPRARRATPSRRPPRTRSTCGSPGA